MDYRDHKVKLVLLVALEKLVNRDHPEIPAFPATLALLDHRPM